MPTENEAKFVLRLEGEDEIAAVCDRWEPIRQGYLYAAKGMSHRVRAAGVSKPKYSMTFKKNARSRTVEVETDLDARDFDDLWGDTIQRLYKVRHYLRYRSLLYEIDSFKDYLNRTYFLMAEVEMPEGNDPPEILPPILTKHLLFRVPLTDCKFASKLIADPRYATELYQRLNDGRQGAKDDSDHQ
jgi:CYTH domain-containing protein